MPLFNQSLIDGLVPLTDDQAVPLTANGVVPLDDDQVVPLAC